MLKKWDQKLFSGDEISPREYLVLFHGKWRQIDLVCDFLGHAILKLSVQYLSHRSQVSYTDRKIFYLASSYISASLKSLHWQKIWSKTSDKYDFGKNNLLFCTIFLTWKYFVAVIEFTCTWRASYPRIFCKKNYIHIYHTFWDTFKSLHQPRVLQDATHVILSHQTAMFSTSHFDVKY